MLLCNIFVKNHSYMRNYITKNFYYQTVGLNITHHPNRSFRKRTTTIRCHITQYNELKKDSKITEANKTTAPRPDNTEKQAKAYVLFFGRLIALGNKKPNQVNGLNMVAAAGVEPARPHGQGILNPSRLPIPSRRHSSHSLVRLPLF